MLQMRWTDTLEWIATECKKGTYEFPEVLGAEEMREGYKYYEDQYMMYEEEMTWEQAENIQKQLEIYKEALKNHYPGIDL